MIHPRLGSSISLFIHHSWLDTFSWCNNEGSSDSRQPCTNNHYTSTAVARVSAQACYSRSHQALYCLIYSLNFNKIEDHKKVAQDLLQFMGHYEPAKLELPWASKIGITLSQQNWNYLEPAKLELPCSGTFQVRSSWLEIEPTRPEPLDFQVDGWSTLTKWTFQRPWQWTFIYSIEIY